MFSMIYWVFAFLRMGTSGLTAQAVGAGNRDLRDACFYRAMGAALFIGLMLVVLQWPIREAMLRFLGSDAATSRLAAQYFDVLIYGAPATMGLYVLNGWMLGIQNARLTMYTSLIINVVNIAASLILVYLAEMGIKGVAAGTLIGQWSGFLAGCAMIVKYSPRLGNLRRLFDMQEFGKFFRVNRDILLRTLCLVAVTVWFTRAGAMQGDIVLSVNALLMQMFILFSYMMDGFAFAGEALVGKLTGAGDSAARRLMIRRLFLHGTAVSLLFTAVYAIFGDGILSVLSDNATVLEASSDYRWWAVSIPFAGFSAFIWDGVFIGETRTRDMLISMAVAMAAFFITYFSLRAIFGNHAVWLAFILYLALRGIVQTILHSRR